VLAGLVPCLGALPCEACDSERVRKGHLLFSVCIVLGLYLWGLKELKVTHDTDTEKASFGGGFAQLLPISRSALSLSAHLLHIGAIRPVEVHSQQAGGPGRSKQSGLGWTCTCSCVCCSLASIINTTGVGQAVCPTLISFSLSLTFVLIRA
jgi:hypothetical protein